MYNYFQFEKKQNLSQIQDQKERKIDLMRKSQMSSNE